MTFDEKCKKFEDNNEKEINLFKRVYRVIFLAKKKEEQHKLEDTIFAKAIQNEKKERAKNRKK